MHPDPHSTTEIIRSLLDGTGGFSAVLREFLSTHGPGLQDKIELVEQGALRQLGAECIKAILGYGRRTFSQRRHQEMTSDDLGKVPASIGDAFLREARYTEEKELRQLWGRLLATYVGNAVDGMSANRAFTSKLADLSPLDAKCLEKIYLVETAPKQPRPLPGFSGPEKWPVGNSAYKVKPVATVRLPGEAFVCEEERRPDVPELELQLNAQIEVSIANLERLGLVEFISYPYGGSDPRRVFQTPLGLEFAKAVLSDEK